MHLDNKSLKKLKIQHPSKFWEKTWFFSNKVQRPKWPHWQDLSIPVVVKPFFIDKSMKINGSAKTRFFIIHPYFWICNAICSCSQRLLRPWCNFCCTGHGHVLWSFPATLQSKPKDKPRYCLNGRIWNIARISIVWRFFLILTKNCLNE